MARFLSNLVAPPRGANKKKKRLGRGDASGHGGTSTKGHKGQHARSGGYHKLGFEGGQMPLIRRIPKRGFTNIFKIEYAVVNVKDLARFAAGDVVDAKALSEKGLIGSPRKPVKILGDGALSLNLTVKAHQFTKSAKEKIEKAGGKAEVLE
ncbi:MAG: 50S ribosomal protein L15 [Deltaproteobacteria bacterium]|nr:50S ribosomal protein L15 [Deltaproteobacteria bacterium]